jgi:hypothetical protein
MTNNKQLSLIDALCIVKTGWRTEQEKELLDNAYLVIKQHSEILHLEYQKECIDEKLFKIKAMTNNKQQTAVEWLWEIAYNRDLTVEDWKQAKEMEKEQRSIKLPSDEEIREVIKPFQNEMDDFDLGFRNGVQWLREKIQGDKQ